MELHRGASFIIDGGVNVVQWFAKPTHIRRDLHFPRRAVWGRSIYPYRVGYSAGEIRLLYTKSTLDRGRFRSD